MFKNPRNSRRSPLGGFSGRQLSSVLLPVYCPFPDCLERHCPTLLGTYSTRFQSQDPSGNWSEMPFNSFITVDYRKTLAFLASDKAARQKCTFWVWQRKVSILQGQDELNWQKFTDITDGRHRPYFQRRNALNTYFLKLLIYRERIWTFVFRICTDQTNAPRKWDGIYKMSDLYHPNLCTTPLRSILTRADNHKGNDI